MPASRPCAEISRQSPGADIVGIFLFGALSSYLQHSRVIRFPSDMSLFAEPLFCLAACVACGRCGGQVVESAAPGAAPAGRVLASPGRKCQHRGAGLHILCWPALSHRGRPPNTVLCWVVLCCAVLFFSTSCSMAYREHEGVCFSSITV